MRLTVCIKRFCLMVAMLPMLCGCIYDHYADETPIDIPGGEADQTTYLRLYVTFGAASRATGGEQGDFSELGINHENDIENLSVFIFNDPDGLGFDCPAATEIRYARRFSSGTLSLMHAGGNAYAMEISMLKYSPQAGDRVAVAVNTVDMSGAKTLGALHEALVYQSYESAPSLADYSYFAMSSANADGLLTMDESHDGTIDHPFAATVTLEHVAARIDFTIPSEDSYLPELGCIGYPVGDTGCRAYLTHIVPVNVMGGGSYLLKRVTAGAPAEPAGLASEPLLYCGSETTDYTDGVYVPTNYVVEPRTLVKAENVEEALQTEWFGNSRAAYIDGNATAFTDDYSVASLLKSNGGAWLPMAISSSSEGKGIIVSYADENTCHRSLQSAGFITGLALRVVYQPQVVYEDAGLTQGLPASDFAPDPATLTGKTIYRYCPDGLGSDEDKCLYFSNAEAAEAYLAAHPAEHATLQSFIDGVCYYNLWLSHATPAPGDYTCPMQYAIVRNNIYRVSVAFTGPGVQPPEIADVQPVTIDCRIYVRKWNAWTHPTIII